MNDHEEYEIRRDYQGKGNLFEILSIEYKILYNYWIGFYYSCKSDIPYWGPFISFVINFDLSYFDIQYCGP